MAKKDRNKLPDGMRCTKCGKMLARHCRKGHPTCNWFPCPGCRLTLVAEVPVKDKPGWWMTRLILRLPSDPSP